MKELAIQLFVALLVLSIAAFIGIQIVESFDSESMRQYVNKSAAWCDARNGTLVNVRAVGHGGLHCEFENGTSVHMWEVVNTSDEG